MAFRINTERKVWWPLVISVAQDGGEVEEIECEILIKLLSTEQLRLAQSMTLPGGASNAHTKMLEEHVLGWRDIEDTDGNTVPFSQENLQNLCNGNFCFAEALGMALANASMGRARLKNSSSGSAG